MKRSFKLKSNRFVDAQSHDPFNSSANVSFQLDVFKSGIRVSLKKVVVSAWDGETRERGVATA